MKIDELTLTISVTDVEPVERILNAVKDIGTVQSDGHFCTCGYRNGGPMITKHGKACVELHEAIKAIK